MNKRRFTFFDYVGLPHDGTTQLNLFNVQQGGTDPTLNNVKTLEYTNVTKASQLPYNFTLKQIRTHVCLRPKSRQPAGISDQADTITKWYRGLASVFTDLCSMGVLNLTLNNKLLLSINQPFRKCPPGFGVAIDQIQTASTYGAFPQQNFTAPLYSVTPELEISRDDVLAINIAFPNTSPVFTNLVNSTSPYIDVGVWLEGDADFPPM